MASSASSLVIVRAAAGLPSFRAPGAAVLAVRRDGAGRGGVLAVRRDGAGRGGVLAVRRDGAGRGGVLAVGFQVPSPLSAWAVKATNAESNHPTEGAASEEDEFELVREMKARLSRNISNSIKVALFDPKDLERKYYQFMLGRYAKSSFDLWVSVSDKFRPPIESKLYEGLKLCGETLITVAVSCSKGQATWKNMSDVVEALELLRRLASSTLEAPLSPDWSLDASRQEGYDNAEVGQGLIFWDASLYEGYDSAEVGLVFVLQRTYVLVQRDIESMLGDGN